MATAWTGWLVLLWTVMTALTVPTDASISNHFVRVNFTKTTSPGTTADSLCTIINQWITSRYYYLSPSCLVNSTQVVTQHAIAVLQVSFDNTYTFDLARTVYEHLANVSRVLATSEGNVEIFYVKHYKTLTEADQDVNAIVLEVCSRSPSLCQENERCVDTAFIPLCTVVCDFGQYSEGNVCIDCPLGKTTLIKEAWTSEQCVDECPLGDYYSLQNLSCIACPAGLFLNIDDNACHVCPYVNSDSTSCTAGTERQVNNQRINLDLDLILITSTCSHNNFSEELKKNADYLNEFVRTMFTLRDDEQYYQQICSPDINDCYNLEARINNNEVCEPDAGCSLDSCDAFRTSLHVTLYYTWQFVQPFETFSPEAYNRSSVDVVLQYLYDLSPVRKSSYLLLDLNPTFQLPFNLKVTVADVTSKSIYLSFAVKEQWVSFEDIGYFILQNMEKTVTELAVVEDVVISNCSPAKCIKCRLLFKHNVDDLLVNKFADSLIQLHEKLAGHSQFLSITGSISVYRTYQDMEAGTNSLNLCDVLNRLSLAASFCQSGDYCVGVNSQGNFTCVNKDSITSSVNTVESITESTSIPVYDVTPSGWYFTQESSDVTSQSSLSQDETLPSSLYDSQSSLSQDEILPSSSYDSQSSLSQDEILPSSSYDSQSSLSQDEILPSSIYDSQSSPSQDEILPSSSYDSQSSLSQDEILPSSSYDSQSNPSQDEILPSSSYDSQSSPSQDEILPSSSYDSQSSPSQDEILPSSSYDSQSSPSQDEILPSSSYDFQSSPSQDEILPSSSYDSQSSPSQDEILPSSSYDSQSSLSQDTSAVNDILPTSTYDSQSSLSQDSSSVNDVLPSSSYNSESTLSEYSSTLNEILPSSTYDLQSSLSQRTTTINNTPSSSYDSESSLYQDVSTVSDILPSSSYDSGSSSSLADTYSSTETSSSTSSTPDTATDDSLVSSASTTRDYLTTAFISTTTLSEASRKQRALYPYGSSAGDSEIVTRRDYDFYYWYDAISEPIYFSSGAPFGSELMKVAHVQENGVITFGKQKRAWWPDLQYITSYSGARVLAPFWTYANPKSNGSVFYHLYDKSSINATDILNRATLEVREQYQLKAFNATVALVATWENVEPYAWYIWLCEYYEYYRQYDWWQTYYQDFYITYCLNKTLETNTFQAVYTTDGLTSYAIVTYKEGAMKWFYDPWRTIQVGFAHADNYKDYGVSYTDLTTKMDSLIWNTGRHGTWIEKVGESKNPDSKCNNFYQSNKYLIKDADHKKQVEDLFECPCTLGQAGAQWWGYSWEELTPWPNMSYVYCLAISPMAKSRLSRFEGNPLNKLCCYKYTYPDLSQYWTWEAWLDAWWNSPYIPYRDENAGFLLMNDPWWWWWGNDIRKSREEDFNPHRWCCEESSKPSYYCGLFNRVRPDYGCTLTPEFISGVALGDPHIKTLDGHEYTMNRLGECILLNITTQKFMLQARTRQVLNSQGNKTAATVFVAFAAKEGNYSRFQVELDSQETGMIITANAHDITLDFYKIKEYNDTFDNGSISIKREDRDNRTMLTASFPSGISLHFYVGIKNLEISMDIPKDYKGKTCGLMGTFNDNPDDDFMLPDGTYLSPNITERIIYEKFAKEWQVTTSNTIFTYPAGLTALDYQDENFKPIFKEEIDAAKLVDAHSKCGNNDACVYDLILTGNVEFATNTLNAMNEASKKQLYQNNNPPVLTLVNKQLNSLLQWEVTHGKPSTLTFTAVDLDGDDNVTFILRDTTSPSVTIDSKSGILTYTPDIKNSLTIGVQAVDSKGVGSNILYVDLVICPDCSGHGVCDRIQTQENEKENGRFVLNACLCWAAYTGSNCETEYDACAEKPCLKGQQCTDKTAAEQGNSTIGYECGPCPPGFEERDNFCVDKNECIKNGTQSVCPENSECTNALGSYTCTCYPGFRLDSNNSSFCKDVDECAEKTHDCQQLCDNYKGGFNCSCLPGNTLTKDKKTCQQDATSAALCGAKGCSQVCTVTDGVASCSCYTGYTNTSDTHCGDVNECTLSNKPCSQSCENKVGGFLCSCYPGYKLDLDGVTCLKCDASYYGTNCSNICVCNGQGTCNHVRGCECNAGWTGSRCTEDVNECSINGACPIGQLCVNTLGSFSCSCPLGYENVTGKCKDINECADVLENNCDLSVEDCINNEGSYTCQCRNGFTREANVCQDINECVTATHNCEQICVNTFGKFSCKCNVGFTLNMDRATCVQNEVDVCAGSGLNCSDICTVDLVTKAPQCLCKTGFSLQRTDKCVDMNECDYAYLNLCSEKDKCHNTVGGYTCSCSPGSKLDNDGRTCIACGQGKWGQECSIDCGCSTGADRCDPRKGCICKPGLTGLQCEKDLDECTTGIVVCGLGEKCVNTIGSASCRCLDGYTKVNGKCQDIDECSSLQTNRCDQVCQNYPGGYTCLCHSGYRLEPVSKNCTDIDECSLNLDGCEQNCENTNGGYHCSCLNGLKLNVDGVTCEVSSKCTTRSCSDKCAVVDRVETCLCPKGKLLDPLNDSQCIDADMCQGNPCSGTCQETPDDTDFACSCIKGKKLAPDGITCIDCTEGTYGDGCSQSCSCTAVNTVSCDKVSGACSCKSGWTGSKCDSDINECSLSASCQANSQCVNTLGSYICKCESGYYLSSGQCLACPAGTYGEECKNQCTCDLTHSTCDKTTGKCICTTGWTGTVCDTDVNECDNLNNDCLKAKRFQWVCRNTPGSYKCTCDAGYEDKNNICVDTDECAASYSNECDGSCTNTVGSYTCSCPAGYKLASDGHRCDDVDECVQGTSGCQQKCTNEVGNFSCSCFTGYTVDETNWRKCYESSGYGFQVEIHIDKSSLNLREKLGKDYLDLKAKLEKCLKVSIIRKVLGLRFISINNMRHGSVIVDFTTAVDTTVTKYAASKMVEAILSIAEKGITVEGVLQNATVIVGNIKVPPVQDKCAILNALEPCGSDSTCGLNSDGEAYCSESSSSVNIPLVIGLCVGLPLALACIVITICCIEYKKKYVAQRQINVREGNYTEPPSTPKDGSRPSSATSFKLAWSEKEKLVS